MFSTFFDLSVVLLIVYYNYIFARVLNTIYFVLRGSILYIQTKKQTSTSHSLCETYEPTRTASTARVSTSDFER